MIIIQRDGNEGHKKKYVENMQFARNRSLLKTAPKEGVVAKDASNTKEKSKGTGKMAQQVRE